MTLDDMQARWAEYDRKLEAAPIAAAAHIRALDRAKSTTQRFRAAIAGGVAANAVLAMCFGLFIARHIGEIKWVAPALLLDLGVAVLLIRGIQQLILLSGRDLGESIVDAQRRIESLRTLRVQTNRWTLALAPLLWVPLLIVSLKGLLGVNAYEAFSGGWFVANMLLGIALIPFTMWLSKRFGDRFHDAGWLKRVMDDVSGRSQASAAKFASELETFKRE